MGHIITAANAVIEHAAIRMKIGHDIAVDQALRADQSRMVSLASLTEMLNTVPTSRWTDRIGEGVGLLARGIDGRSMPAGDGIEWFAEWVREAWGAQSGLKLLTAHRAKGLEFDDVVILYGGWEGPSRNEDQDAPWRLFYVAMTRARRNLVLMSNDNHEYLPEMVFETL